MQALIEMPDEKAERLLAQMRLDSNFRECEVTILPKGHGDLKDITEIERLWQKGDCDSLVSALIFAQTVIKADKAEYDDKLSKEDRAIIDAMRNTAYVCGHRGEALEYVVHKALKRIGRSDLLPPCERKGEA